MLMTDAMVGPHKPGLKISEYEVDDRQIFFGDLMIATLGDGEVEVATFDEAGITAPVIRDYFCAWLNRSLNEAAKRLCATVRDNGESHTTGVSAALALIEFATRLPLPDLNGSGDKNLIVDATALSASSSSDIALVYFDVLVGITSYPILIWAHHPRAKLMENLEGSLVTGDAQLPLKLHGRHARGLTGHQIGRPEPNIQRRMRTFHHSPHRQPSVTPTLAASKDTGATRKAKGVAHRRAIRANKSVGPTQFQQVKSAGFVVREKSLELWKGVRKQKIVALVDVHEHGSGIIPAIAEGNNRIGMNQTSTITGQSPCPRQPFAITVVFSKRTIDNAIDACGGDAVMKRIVSCGATGARAEAPRSRQRFAQRGGCGRG